MKQTFTLAVVLVFFTLCSFGQKKEIMRNNMSSTNKVKTHEDLRFPQNNKSKTPENTHFLHDRKQDRHHLRRNDLLTNKAKTRHSFYLKSAEAVKQRLDSIVGVYGNAPGFKVYFTYDSKGNLTQELEYEWESNLNTWEKYKYDYTYDASGNITQEISFDWDSNTNAWIANYKGDDTYDAAGNITQERGYGWDNNTKTWINNLKGDYTYDAKGNQTQYSYLYWDETNNTWQGQKYDNNYDANGNITQKTDSYWDGDTNAWVAIFKSDNIYDANKNLLQSSNSFWDGNSNTWDIGFKEEYTYNSSGDSTQYLHYWWNDYTNSYDVQTKTDITYDSKGYMVQSIDSLWDNSSNALKPARKSENTYDSNGNITQELDYNWDLNTNAWLFDLKSNYTYDASGYLIQNRDYKWDSNINAWVGNGASERSGDYTYDANGNLASAISYYEFDEITSQFIPTYKYENSLNLSYTLSDLIFPMDWLDEEIMNMPLEESYYYWDKASNSWVDDEKYVYYYTEINFTSVPKTVVSGINIYPNPVSDYVKVSGVSGAATFNLYNLQGKLILSKTLTANEPVNISGLSKGAYTYNIIVDQKQQAGKIIKK